METMPSQRHPRNLTPISIGGFQNATNLRVQRTKLVWKSECQPVRKTRHHPALANTPILHVVVDGLGVVDEVVSCPRQKNVTRRAVEF